MSAPTPWPTVCAIRAWHAEGRATADIARGLGMPYATVYQIVVGRYRLVDRPKWTPAVKRANDRAALRAKRNAMTPEERAAHRREHDRAYRERHREERRKASLDRYYGLKKQQTPAA